MGYSSDNMKKIYRKQCDKQRGENLRRLREDIARLTMRDFSLIIGITISDLSNLENGDKTLSLFHIQAYKYYFKENHNLDISADYLMGYTSKITNDSTNAKNINEDIFISDSLGLKPQTIAKIRNYDDKIKELINRLSLNKGDDLLEKFLVMSLKYARNEHDYYSVENLITKEGGKLDKKENEIVKRAIVNDTISLILSDAKKLYTSDNKKDMDDYVKKLEKFKADYEKKEQQKGSD